MKHPRLDQRRCTLVQKNKMLHHPLIDVKRDIAAEPNNTNHDPVFIIPISNDLGIFFGNNLGIQAKKITEQITKDKVRKINGRF